MGLLCLVFPQIIAALGGANFYKSNGEKSINAMTLSILPSLSWS